MSVSVHLPALKDIRVAKGFTQEALAAAIHKTTKTISRIENGDPTSIETAKLLAQVLELKSFAQLQSIESTGLFKQFLKEIFSIVTSSWTSTMKYLPFFVFFNMCVNVGSTDLGVLDTPITLGMVLESAGKCIIPLFTFSLGFSSYRFADSYSGELYTSAFNQWAKSESNLKYVSDTNITLGLCSAAAGIILPVIYNNTDVSNISLLPLFLLSLVYIVGVVAYAFLFNRLITGCFVLLRNLNRNATR